MASSIENPYLAPETAFEWLRGNLHSHTTNSDGERPPQEVVDDYAGRGYDFLMLSDHDVFTDPAALNANGMMLLPGVEVTARGPHILQINTATPAAPDADRQRVLDQTQGTSLAVVAHPNWERHFNHCPQERLDAWRGYSGIEIYNGVVQRLEGSPYATDRWDRLLAAGRRVWGFANDDSHAQEDVGRAWNVVQCATRTPAAVLDGLRHGRFYASTGVRIDSIYVEGHTINVVAANAQYLVAYSDHGKMEYECDGPELGFMVPENAPMHYVRVECWGPGRSMAWTQPFWVS
jgi:hypothetical protein